MIGGALAAPSDRHRRLFHRHVEPDIVVHGCFLFDARARRPVVSPFVHPIEEQPPASMSVTADSGRLAPAITPCIRLEPHLRPESIEALCSELKIACGLVEPPQGSEEEYSMKHYASLSLAGQEIFDIEGIAAGVVSGFADSREMTVRAQRGLADRA
jgi:hypothetical protein